jgi:rhodanese-related sulfurtransferase
MKKIIPILIISTLVLTGCGNTLKVNNLSVNDFANKITDQKVTIIDVRTPAEFAAGHISGAQNIDWESGHFEQDILKENKTSTYAVYCRSGNRSGQATSLMLKDGFSSIYNLEGGLINWVSAGKTLVSQ